MPPSLPEPIIDNTVNEECWVVGAAVAPPIFAPGTAVPGAAWSARILALTFATAAATRGSGAATGAALVPVGVAVRWASISVWTAAVIASIWACIIVAKVDDRNVLIASPPSDAERAST